jgi:hypothetical protein
VILTAIAVLALAAPALATPAANGVVFTERVFDDCPFSTLTTTNLYPMLIAIDDANLSCGGFANLHVWTLSEDGGATEAVFNNNSWFRLAADLTVTGTADGEAGLRVSPWWSQYVDGRLNVRTTDGEIACFGGRLPFYSFTGEYGLHYMKGDTIHLEVIYRAQALTSANPATIEYIVGYGGMTYSSGQLPFDEGNPMEPYGTWGMLDDARVGGFSQVFLQAGNEAAEVRAEWTDIEYEILQVIATEETSWGAVKALY